MNTNVLKELLEDSEEKIKLIESAIKMYKELPCHQDPIVNIRREETVRSLNCQEGILQRTVGMLHLFFTINKIPLEERYKKVE